MHPPPQNLRVNSYLHKCQYYGGKHLPPTLLGLAVLGIHTTLMSYDYQLVLMQMHSIPTWIVSHCQTFGIILLRLTPMAIVSVVSHSSAV